MRRHNLASAYDTPAGTFRCPALGCAALVPDEAMLKRWFTCGNGHTHDTRELERLAYEPGGWTHSGLTCTDQGAIGERIVRGLPDLGEYGRVLEWCEAYNAPLDGIATSGLGIEVKTVDAGARNYVWNPGRAAYKRSKDNELDARGLVGLLAIAVVLDWRGREARLHVRRLDRCLYWIFNGTEVWRRVPLDPAAALAA